MALSYHIIPYEEPFVSRCDRWLKRLYPNLTQGRIQRALRQRFVRVNQAKSQASTPLAKGDELAIEIHLHEQWLLLGTEQAERPRQTKDYSAFILDETEDLLVMNKPSGLDVQGGTHVSQHLDAWLHQSFPEARLVHRLDRMTSGILLIAKNLKTAIELSTLFRQRKVQKTYRALVVGRLKEKQGTIDQSLVTKTKQGERKLVSAQTTFKVLNEQSAWSEVELHPLTGRKHQLRIHMANLGHPILGDTKYDLDHKACNLLKPKDPLFLHAFRLSLRDAAGRKHSWTAPLPAYWPSQQD